MNVSQAETIAAKLLPLINTANAAHSRLSYPFRDIADRYEAVSHIRDMLGWADQVRAALKRGGDLGTASDQEIFDAVRNGVEIRRETTDFGDLQVSVRMTFGASFTLSENMLSLATSGFEREVERHIETIVRSIIRSLSDERLDRMVSEHKAKLAEEPQQ
jgi:hypothetical protein